MASRDEKMVTEGRLFKSLIVKSMCQDKKKRGEDCSSPRLIAVSQ